MKNNKTGTVDLLNQLKEIGYVHTFLLDNEKLKCIESEKSFNPHELKLCGTFRYEGMSDPDDSRVVYALETQDGTKGIIMDAFGTYASPQLGAFLDSVYDARTECTIMQDLPAKKTIEIHAL